MLIGVPKEIKPQEFRVGLVPGSVRELVAHGHEVIVQSGAGTGIGALDEDYRTAGASISASAEEIFARAQLIVKVKEPQIAECKLLQPQHILFTYLHLAPDPQLARELQESGATCIAYETVTADNGSLPLLAPMSEIAGRLSVQAGAHWLEKAHGGRGILLGGVPGVAPGKVVVLGGGAVGQHAVAVALGMGADVWVLDCNMEVLRRLWRQFGQHLNPVYSTHEAVEQHVSSADLVIGSVLIPGAAAPKLITHALVRRMKPGSVIVDVAIDQGGCCETSRPTTHDAPTYLVDGVIHYCVANMPGCVPCTSAQALNNATLPYVIKLADEGLAALLHDRHLRNGLNVFRGNITNAPVAAALGQPYIPPEPLLAQLPH
jgi:alanine dehydrogenase